MLLRAFKPDGDFRVTAGREPWSRRYYQLWRRGDRFPLAGGDMGHIMRVHRELAE